MGPVPGRQDHDLDPGPAGGQDIVADIVQMALNPAPRHL